MNWMKAILAGVAGGIVVNIYSIVVHGFIMQKTYMKYPVFGREPASPGWFVLVSVLIGVFAAILFARTRSAWAPGARGGAMYGFWLGMVSFFAQFYYPLVIDGFPYYLAWCWGGITLIGMVIFGLVAGAIYKQASA